MSSALHSTFTYARVNTERKWLPARSQSKSLSPMVMTIPLQELQFEHTALASLPVDENRKRQVRSEIPGVCFSLVDVQPLEGPEVVCTSQSALDLLGVHADETDPEIAQILSLSTTFSNCKSYAHCYCGHQFGAFAGQLGDGAATSIGEVNTVDGRWELQFKGAGQTPYSRAGDGRKVLRSSVREFLASEAMHHLGIPTTRAASVCTSKSTVVRDPFYTGNAIHEPCAVVLRLAPSFLRFGSLEIVRRNSNTGRRGPSADTPELAARILDYLVFYHYRSIWDMCGGGPDLMHPPSQLQKQEMYLSLYEQVLDRTLKLCAQWQGVGFCHGVLNTDNMSLLGLTIDYGPYGWLDRYDNGHICNSSDDGGRYAFGKQPWAVKENLQKLGEMITLAGAPAPPPEGEPPSEFPGEVSKVHAACEDRYTKHFHDVMRKKLGLQQQIHADSKLFSELQACMQETGVDFTIAFRSLSLVPFPSAENGVGDESGVQEFLDVVLATCPDPKAMAEKTRSKIDPQQLMFLQKVASEQPGMLARIGLSYEDVTQEVKKNEDAAAIAAQTAEEKKKQDEELWREWLGSYQQRLRRELAAGTTAEQHVDMMKAANPKIVLRNWVAQVAIDAAAKGDYATVKRILGFLEEPFKDWPRDDILLDVGVQKHPADQPPPEPLENLCKLKPKRHTIGGTMNPAKD